MTLVRRARTISGLVACLLVVSCVVGSATSSRAAASPRVQVGECFRPTPPRRFQRQVRRAIRISRDLPARWAGSPEIAKIACWQGTGFAPEFRERGRSYYVWRGVFAMTVQEMQTVHGTWMTADRSAFRLSKACFTSGWGACPHRAEYSAWTQQIIAGLRWIWLHYGSPSAAWGHIKRTGRFNSYPRPGTADRPTRDPFRHCPVRGRAYFRDSFGERRTVGGYHPHWGNDVVAPAGTPVPATFDGFAVAHRDGWFAGLYVTVVGRRGYTRNVHLSRTGKLGWVRAGDVVGYVGATGDARGPHNHFEWHPWAAPYPRHRSPFGFSLVMDAIDPYPFLLKACGARRSTPPSGVRSGPLEP